MADTDQILERLHALGSEEGRAGLARFGIPQDRALGVAMRDMKALAKDRGTDHALALALWETGIYDARTVAVFIADPGQLDGTTMDRWVADIDTWALCDTACFSLFDQTESRWRKAAQWIADDREFVRRAGFAMIWALALHDEDAPDTAFGDALDLIETAPDDARPLVRKAMDMALRAVGSRNAALNSLAITTAERMQSERADCAKWVGRTALKKLTTAKLRR